MFFVLSLYQMKIFLLVLFKKVRKSFVIPKNVVPLHRK